MVQGFKVELLRFPPFADFRIVAVVVADRNRRMAHIGDHELDGVHICFDSLDFLIEDVDVVAELLHGCNLSVGIFFIAFELADFLGNRIAFILHGFDFFEGFHAVYRLRRRRRRRRHGRGDS